MIIQFKVRAGATFTLDKELSTWERYFAGRRTHGKLYAWPTTIEVGKNVWIFNVETGNIGRAFCTTTVTEMHHVERDEPNVVEQSSQSASAVV